MKTHDPDTLNDTLIARYHAGDPTARDELIVANQPLVYTTVDRTLRIWTNFQYLHDDLVGEGMIALVLAVDRLLLIKDTDRQIRNYLITAIRNRLVSELVGSQSGRGQVDHYQTTQYLDSYHRISEQVLAEDDPVFAQIEDHEFFMSLCETEREREILSYFLAGKSQVDIIATTEHTRHVVSNTLVQFRRKLRESPEFMAD